MRVLQILGEPVGGTRKHVHQIISASNQFDVSMSYVCGDVIDSVGFSDIVTFMELDIPIIKCKIPKKPNWRDLVNLFNIVNFCIQHRPSVIHGHGAKGGVYARIVGLVLRIKVIYTPHGGSLHKGYGRFEGFIYRCIEKILKPLTPLYLFESSYSHERFVKLCGPLECGRYTVNHNGVEPKAFHQIGFWLDGIEVEINLLVVGMLRHAKGQDIAIKALKILKDKQPDYRFHLHFCGAGSDERWLQSLVAECGLCDLVTFHGDVTNVEDYYQASNVVIIPSRLESFGYVAVEACFMGRPVIAANCGGLVEIIEDNRTGYLFTVDDPIALADKIFYAIENKKITSEIIMSAADNVAKKFSLNSMLNGVYSNYQNIVN